MFETTLPQVKIMNVGRTDIISESSRKLVKGLSARDTLIPTVYYYDDRGSEIFQELCLEESYYLPMAELQILMENSSSIAEMIGNKKVIELGCGDCHKSIVLLQRMMELHGRCKFIPIDVSDYIIEQACRIITKKIPGIDIDAIRGTYEEAITYLGNKYALGSIYIFLGSTMAQFNNEMISEFIELIRKSAKPGDLFLVGFDLFKSVEILRAPYNTDSAVRHQLNALHNINKIYNGNFDPNTIQCEGRWNNDMKRIEMTLTFTRDQDINLKKLNFRKFFKMGDEIMTHIMRKMEKNTIIHIFMDNNMKCKKTWLNERYQFCMFLFEF